MKQAAMESTVYDIDRIRADFPILSRKVNGRPLVYLDNAATSQKPHQVLDALVNYYSNFNANVHRGVHTLSQEATEAYEGAREKIRRFINAPSTREIIFTSGTTGGINLMTRSYATDVLAPGDEVLITHMEHHSNIVPWQIICREKGATLKVAAIDDRGVLDMTSLDSLLSERTRIVAINHVSNALGTINPIRVIADKAHAAGAVLMVDGAQAAPHMRIDLAALDCDFYTVSGHKMFGPTGIGVLYARERLLEKMPPYQGGGEMIKMVSFEKTVYNDLPYKFEAGTPNIAGAIGLAAAIDYMETIGLDAISAHEHSLLDYGHKILADVPGLHFIGTAPDKAGVLSFVLDYAHPHDIGTLLDHEGIAVRTGHHCAQPVMDRFGVPATVRASLALYNNRQDLDALVLGLKKVHKVFG